MPSSMIKTYHKSSFLVLLLLNLGILETKHKCATLLSTDLAWNFHYFCVRLFVLCSATKKRELPYSRKFLYNILNFSISYFN